MGSSGSSRESAAAGSSSAADVAGEARLPMNPDTPTSEGVGGFKPKKKVKNETCPMDLKSKSSQHRVPKQSLREDMPTERH